MIRSLRSAVLFALAMMLLFMLQTGPVRADCAIDEFCNDILVSQCAGATDCLACPTGYSSTGYVTGTGGASADTDCTLDCGGGLIVNYPDICLSCAVGEYLEGGVCEQCPIGYTSTGYTAGVGGATSDADCTPNTYTITLNKKGGTGTVNGTSGTADASINCDFEQICTLPSVSGITRTGFAATGRWCDVLGANCQTAGVAFQYNTVGDSTFYIEYEYTVTYLGNSNTSGTAPSATVCLDWADTVCMAADNTGTLERTGYNFTGWNTLADGTGTRIVPGKGIKGCMLEAPIDPDCVELPTGDQNLYAEWTPKCLTITLDDTGAATLGTPSPIYLLYDNGWFSNSACTVPIASLTTLPLMSGHILLSYCENAATSCGQQVIDADGDIVGGYDAFSTDETIYAWWNYTVTYDGNESDIGAVPGDTKCIRGTNCTLAVQGTMDRAGYDFVGWNTLIDGTGMDYTAGMSTFQNAVGDIALYARWTPKTFTLTLNKNGGTGTVAGIAGILNASHTCTMDADCTLPAMTGLTQSGFVQANLWCENADGSGNCYAAGAIDTFHTPSDATLYAKYTYTVSYDDNGAETGTVPSPTTCVKSANCTLATNSGGLSRTGFAFQGWNMSPGGNLANFAPGATNFINIPGNITLYAKWEGAIHQISLDMNGGESNATPDTIYVKYGTGWYGDSLAYIPFSTLTTLPTLTGHDTTGYWTLASGGTQIINDAGAIVAGNLEQFMSPATIYAQWVPSIYPITLGDNGGAGGSGTVYLQYGNGWSLAMTGPFGSGVTVDIPARDHYVFQGYFYGIDQIIDEDGAVQPGFETFTEGPRTLLANWTGRPYQITFDGGNATGGSPMAVKECIYAQPCTLPANTFTKAGYIFGGWAASGAGASTGATLHSDAETFDFLDGADVTYHAIWYYTARFAANGGTGSASPINNICFDGGTCAMANAGTLAKPIYVFDGWSTVNDGTGVVAFPGDTPATDSFNSYLTNDGYLNMYARWKHTLIFDGNSAPNAPAATDCFVNGPCVLPLPGMMDKSGYSFDGWNRINDGSGTNFDAGTTYDHSLDLTAANTLFARWKYTLVFDGNLAKTGSVPPSADLYFNQDYTMPDNIGDLARPGNIFEGWDRLPEPADTSTGHSVGSVVSNMPDKPQAQVTGSVMTIYAKWFGCDPGYWNDGLDKVCHPSGPGHHTDGCDDNGNFCTGVVMCEYGTYAPGSANVECDPSDPGNHTDDCLDAVNWLGCQAQTPCEVGTYSGSSGAGRECITVPEGGYTEGDGNTGYNVCAEGSYNTGTGNYDDTALGGPNVGCTPCPPGTTTSGGGTLSALFHAGIGRCNQTCGIYGMILDDVASYDDRWWDVTTNTVYSIDGVNMRAPICSVQTCKAGAYRKSETECEPCDPGTFTAVENYSSSCTECAKGSYNDVPRSTECTLCMEDATDWSGTFGSSTLGTGSTSCDADCGSVIPSLKDQPDGIIDPTLVSEWEQSEWSSSGSTAMSSVNTVTNDCVITGCRAGAYYRTGECWLCGIGSYSTVSGSIACEVCQSTPGNYGLTTTGYGQTVCNASCWKQNVQDWLATLWEDLGLLNGVPNNCGVKICEKGYYYSSVTLGSGTESGGGNGGGVDPVSDNGQGHCMGKCRPGYYCPPGSIDDEGTTATSECDTEMGDCPGGPGPHPCLDGWSSALGSWKCTQCPPAAVSNPGTIPPGFDVVPGPDYDIMVQSPGAPGNSDLTPRATCWYCGGGLRPDATHGSCEQCPPGTFKPTGQELLGIEECTVCPVNSTCSAPGLEQPVCQSGYELEILPGGIYLCNPIHIPCTIGDNGYGHIDKVTDECILDGCMGNNHMSPDGTQCDPNVKPCIVTGGNGYQTWDTTANDYGLCVVSECDTGYELVAGACLPCNRPNATQYKPGGGCTITACTFGYHPNVAGSACEGDTIVCTAPHATVAMRLWENGQFGVCTVIACEPGYHINSNACVLDSQACAIENGSGVQEWVGDSATGYWGECRVASCNPGFTSDPSESAQPTKKCGTCKNRYGLGGETAVSSYVAGCEIATCMYQGELYNLENNECVPLCTGTIRSDETGMIIWNPTQNKCVRTCSDGYIDW